MVKINWSEDVVRSAVDFADCIELLVAFSRSDYDCRFSFSDFEDILESEIVNEDRTRLLQGEEVDEYMMYFEQAVTMVSKRANWLQGVYPFQAKSQQVFWDCSPDSGLIQQIYLFLLACSASKYIPSMSGLLPTAFEELGRIAITSMFSEQAQVLQFGPRSADRSILGWSAREAVPKLARKLNADLQQEDRLPVGPRDFGIDVIAIFGFADAVSYPFFATAQCATGDRWWEKKHEAKVANGLVEFIRLNLSHTNFLLIPHFPRIQLDEWNVEPSLTGDCVLCDRYRLCRLIESNQLIQKGIVPEDSSERLREVLKTIVNSINGNSNS